MQSANHHILATMLNDMADHELAADKIHHYKLAKMQMMEVLTLESNQSFEENDMHGAVLMMSYALKWWEEVGLLSKGGE
jgi:hypothetical protein